ncbi:glycosyltransferase family A protein [Paratractidigestivibacter sp.]|uniref:glycosyltransferase family 2 protein n=1 Tax=Paratractidigestivibacter sp. TaxID=2847316 RepID=UPI002ABD22C9|nr:glycosyltransferase family A protein [Paratractidigestivibacter sp.]
MLMCARNAEKTLRRALDSIQNQTLRNVETVVVDAGSTDGTARALDVASERDIRVRVEHVPECPREEALNLALADARGDYLFVMDPDAWIESTYLQKLVDAVAVYHAELVVGGVSAEVVSGRRTVEMECDDEDTRYLTQHDFRADAWRHFASGRLMPATGKLFVRERVASERCRFDAQSGNDHSFVADYLRRVERVAFVGRGYRVSRELPNLGGADGARELFARLNAGYDDVHDLLSGWDMLGDPASMDMLTSRYLEMLALCVECACSGSGQGGDKGDGVRELVRKLISSERAQLAASVAKPRDGAAKALVGPIKTQNVQMAIVQARLLNVLRRGAPSTLTPDAFL